MVRYKDLRIEFVSLQPLAKNFLIPLPPGKISAPVYSSPPPKKNYPSPLHKNFNVMTQ